MINVSNLNGDSNSKPRHGIFWADAETKASWRLSAGGKCTAIPRRGGTMISSVPPVPTGDNSKTKQERARRGSATVATQHSGSYVGLLGLLVRRSSSRPEASGRDLPRKWCWSRRWSTWCSSSLREPWNASRKSSGRSFFVRLDRHHELSGRRGFASTVLPQCLTALLNFIIIIFAPRLRRSAVDCFSGRSPTWCRAWVNKRRRECGGGSRSVLPAARVGWKRSIHACEEKVEGYNPPNRTRLKPAFRYPSHNLDMAVNLSGKIGRPMSVGRGRRGGTSSSRGRHCPDMTCDM